MMKQGEVAESAVGTDGTGKGNWEGIKSRFLVDYGHKLSLQIHVIFVLPCVLFISSLDLRNVFINW